jgi:hypothetical protein
MTAFDDIEGINAPQLCYIKLKVKERWDFMYGDAHGLGYLLDPRYCNNHFEPILKAELTHFIIQFGQVDETIQTQRMVDLSNFLSEAERLPPQVQEWLNSGIMKPKNFWAMNGSRWPSIKPLATKIFALVTSTTSSERSWSTQGYIHSKIRNCLGN